MSKNIRAKLKPNHEFLRPVFDELDKLKKKNPRIIKEMLKEAGIETSETWFKDLLEMFLPEALDKLLSRRKLSIPPNNIK